MIPSDGSCSWSGDAGRQFEVDIWTIDLDARFPGDAADADSLSDEERERCSRFRFPQRRDRFRRGRVALRSILSLYTGTPPKELAFAQGTAGKPHLRCDRSRVPHFSFSRADGLAMLAVAPSPVGIDIATLDARFACAGTAAAGLDRTEVQAWTLLPEERRFTGFFKAWTSREAVVKAEGTGLASPSPFSVCVDPDRPPQILRGATGWRLHPVPSPSSHAAAICTSSSIEAFHLKRWNDLTPSFPNEVDDR